MSNNSDEKSRSSDDTILVVLPEGLWTNRIGGYLLGFDINRVAQVSKGWRERARGMIQSQLVDHQTVLYPTPVSEEEKDAAWMEMGDLEFDLTKLVVVGDNRVLSPYCALLDYLHWVRATNEWPVLCQEMAYDHEYIHYWSPFITIRKKKWFFPEILYAFGKAMGEFEWDGMIDGLPEPMDQLPLQWYMASQDTLVFNCHSASPNMHSCMQEASRVLLYSYDNKSGKPPTACSILVTTQETLRESVTMMSDKVKDSDKQHVKHLVEQSLASPYFSSSDNNDEENQGSSPNLLAGVVSYRLGQCPPSFSKAEIAQLQEKYQQSFATNVAKLMMTLRQEYITLYENFQYEKEQQQESKKRKTTGEEETIDDEDDEPKHPLVRMYKEAFGKDGLNWKARATTMSQG